MSGISGFCVALLVGTAVGLSNAAWAVTKTSNLGVSATVTDECFIDTSQALNFGSVEVPISTDRQVSATVIITCDAPPSVGTLSFNGGLYYGSKGLTTQFRAMARSSGGAEANNRLAYRLSYTDNYNAAIVPDVAYGLTFDANFDASFTVWGTLVNPQTARPGNYSDTVIVTLGYDY